MQTEQPALKGHSIFIVPMGVFKTTFSKIPSSWSPGAPKRSTAYLWVLQIIITGINYGSDELIQLILLMLNFSCRNKVTTQVSLILSVKFAASENVQRKTKASPAP